MLSFDVGLQEQEALGLPQEAGPGWTGRLVHFVATVGDALKARVGLAPGRSNALPTVSDAVDITQVLRVRIHRH